MKFCYDLTDVAPYINWAYFYFAWQVKQPKEQQRLRREAELFLTSLAGKYHTFALVSIEEAFSEGDDIVLAGSGVHLPFLRQQSGTPCYCLSDFIAPQHADVPDIYHHLALFATSVDQSMERDFDMDPYQKMMAQLLADRLAEATAELVHEQVRKKLWGYAPDEHLSISEMQLEHFQGIRPAVGYPSMPDNSLNFLLNELLDFGKIGITLTESAAMRPHASVSGLMLAHPDAHYFAVGKIGEDQLRDYACRRQLPLDHVRKFLISNL